MQSRFYSPNRKSIFINCKQFYPLHKLSSIALVAVYIHLHTNCTAAISGAKSWLEANNFSFHFHWASLNQLKYRQHIKSPTSECKTLNHCYSVFKDAYRSVPQAAIGNLDHCIVHLIPTYKDTPKAAKPVVKTVKRWATEAELQSVFSAADLDEQTDTATSYISFYENMFVPTNTHHTYLQALFHKRKVQPHQTKEVTGGLAEESKELVYIKFYCIFESHNPHSAWICFISSCHCVSFSHLGTFFCCLGHLLHYINGNLSPPSANPKLSPLHSMGN